MFHPIYAISSIFITALYYSNQMKFLSKILENVSEKIESMGGEIWPKLGSLAGGLMVTLALSYQYFFPYVQINFDEYSADQLTPNDAYVYIENYLSDSSARQAKVLRAVQFAKDSGYPLLKIHKGEKVTDKFEGVKVWWSSWTNPNVAPPLISRNPDRDEKRYYILTFRESHLDFITKYYVPHVLKEGKANALRQRERKLYLNIPSRDWEGNRTSKWSHVAFEHPATFETLALDPKQKVDLVNDLIKFSLRKDYYAKIGKAWKRGYLLYGPPGTGKSTTIAAMANLLKYDVYDLELTTVKDNSQLKRLMMDTKSKSIIVIEDIDCSLDLTGQRKKKKKKEDNEKNEVSLLNMADKEEESDSKITLSGLLNSIDGLWSACGEERIIVFTTNYVDKLDEALIRKGRMDMHIKLSYCCFEAFKVLAKNYLDIDSHHLFAEIGRLLEEKNISPADVVENLMPLKSDSEDVELFGKIRSLLGKTDMTPADVVEKLKRMSDNKEGDVEFEKILEKIDTTSADIAEKSKRMSEIKDVDVETCLTNLIEVLEKAPKKEKVPLMAEKDDKEKEQSAPKDAKGDESIIS